MLEMNKENCKTGNQIIGVHFPQLQVQKERNYPPTTQISCTFTCRIAVLVPILKKISIKNRKGTVKSNKDDSRNPKPQLKPATRRTCCGIRHMAYPLFLYIFLTSLIVDFPSHFINLILAFFP